MVQFGAASEATEANQWKNLPLVGLGISRLWAGKEGEYLEPFGRVIGNPMPDDAVLTVRQYADATGAEPHDLILTTGTAASPQSNICKKNMEVNRRPEVELVG